MSSILEEKLSIEHSSDVYAARKKTAGLAMKIGFDDKAIHELSIVASELAANVLAHAGKGILNLFSLLDDQRKGIHIETVDQGPGLFDADQSVTDGYSTSVSLGYGLGTVNRLMDEMEFSPNGTDLHGAHVSARRWLSELQTIPSKCPYDIGVATRAYPGMKQNGDSYVVKQHGASVLTAIIDGLGHGQFANRAAQKAAQYIESHSHESFENMFQGTFRACRGTRGVVMALFRLNWDQENASFACIGNIETRILSGDGSIQFPIRRGVVGVNSPKPVVTHKEWSRENIVILFTDGISSHWKWSDVSHLLSQSSNLMARDILFQYGKENDDATVIVIKKHLN